MSYGLEVYNELGTLNFTTNKLLAHKVGQFIPTSRTGSFTVPAGAGDVWAFHNPMGFGSRSDGIGVWVAGDLVNFQMYSYKVSDRPVIQFGRYSS